MTAYDAASVSFSPSPGRSGRGFFVPGGRWCGNFDVLQKHPDFILHRRKVYRISFGTNPDSILHREQSHRVPVRIKKTPDFILHRLEFLPAFSCHEVQLTDKHAKERSSFFIADRLAAFLPPCGVRCGSVSSSCGLPDLSIGVPLAICFGRLRHLRYTDFIAQKPRISFFFGT